MGEPAPSLKAALAERYAIERELGRDMGLQAVVVPTANFLVG